MTTPTRIAINGFGRIGRHVLRALIEQPRDDIEVVAVNATAALDACAHLLRYDSVHGRLDKPIGISDNGMDIGTAVIPFTSSRDIGGLDWNKYKVDIVLECTGAFNNREASAQHLTQGAKRVLVSAPCKQADMTVVYGVNHRQLTPDQHVVSNASCTTNCFAPLAKVLHQTVGIETGFMTTIHSYTTDQRLLDNRHKDWYRARAAAGNIVPTSTGAAKAVEMVLPELSGRLDGVALRVPTPNVSAVDFTFTASQPTSVAAINQALQQAASSPDLHNVLAVTQEPLVSSDLNHTDQSSIVAQDQTRVVNQTFCRSLAWYDNEWAFCLRMLDIAAVMGGLLK